MIKGGSTDEQAGWKADEKVGWRADEKLLSTQAESRGATGKYSIHHVTPAGGPATHTHATALSSANIQW